MTSGSSSAMPCFMQGLLEKKVFRRECNITIVTSVTQTPGCPLGVAVTWSNNLEHGNNTNN